MKRQVSQYPRHAHCEGRVAGNKLHHFVERRLIAKQFSGQRLGHHEAAFVPQQGTAVSSRDFEVE
jgi:hypothetical protein